MRALSPITSRGMIPRCVVPPSGPTAHAIIIISSIQALWLAHLMITAHYCRVRERLSTKHLRIVRQP